MLCSKCRRQALLSQRYSGLHLCKAHFVADLESKAKRAIREHQWIVPGDRIGVPFTNGRDSSALLHFLKQNFGDRRDLSLVAIAIDAGEGVYGDWRAASRVAESLGIERILIALKGVPGEPVGEGVHPGEGFLSSPFSGATVHPYVDRIAREQGVTRLAFCSSVDDEALAVLGMLVRGDADRLMAAPSMPRGILPAIYPFHRIPGREIALYALLHLEGFDTREPSGGIGAGGDAYLRSILDDFDWRHPSTKYALAGLGDRLASWGQFQVSRTSAVGGDP